MSLARQAETATWSGSALLLKLRMLLAFQPVKHKVNWNGSQLMDHYFKSPVLKTFFLGIVADFVTAPSEFPALGVPSIHLETAFDKRIPTYPGTRSAQTAYTYILGGCQIAGGCGDGCDPSQRREGADQHGREAHRHRKRAGHRCGSGGWAYRTGDLVLASGGMKEVFFDLVGREYIPAELDHPDRIQPADGIGADGAAWASISIHVPTNPRRCAITTRPMTWKEPSSACAPATTMKARKAS